MLYCCTCRVYALVLYGPEYKTKPVIMLLTKQFFSTLQNKSDDPVQIILQLTICPGNTRHPRHLVVVTETRLDNLAAPLTNFLRFSAFPPLYSTPWTTLGPNWALWLAGPSAKLSHKRCCWPTDDIRCIYGIELCYYATKPLVSRYQIVFLLL